MPSDPSQKPAAPSHPLAPQEIADLIRQTDRIRLVVNGVVVEVPPELDAAVRRACETAVQALPEEMTPAEAATFLGVSRPFVVKLTRQRKLPCRMVGKHRRIPTGALQAYREQMFQEARNACDEMTRISQELGLYDREFPPNAR